LREISFGLRIFFGIKFEKRKSKKKSSLHLEGKKRNLEFFGMERRAFFFFRIFQAENFISELSLIFHFFFNEYFTQQKNRCDQRQQFFYSSF